MDTQEITVNYENVPFLVGLMCLTKNTKNVPQLSTEKQAKIRSFAQELSLIGVKNIEISNLSRGYHYCPINRLYSIDNYGVIKLNY